MHPATNRLSVATPSSSLKHYGATLKTRSASLLSAALIFIPALTQAALTHDFNLAIKLNHAQAIVLATEGDTLDGRLTVLSSFRGDLKPGELIHLPLLANFHDPTSRKIHPKKHAPPNARPPAHKAVSGRLMLLFLTTEEGKVERLNKHSYYNNICWIEGNHVYAMSHANTAISDELPLLMEHELSLESVLKVITNRARSES